MNVERRTALSSMRKTEHCVRRHMLDERAAVASYLTQRNA